MGKTEQVFSIMWNKVIIFLNNMVTGKDVISLFGCALALGVILGVVLMLLNKKYSNENKVRDGFILIAIVIVLVYMIALAVLGWDNTRIRDAEILLTMATIMAPIISFMGAYQLIKMESKEKKKEDKEYALQMLYYLLNNCIKETNSTVEKIIDDYNKTFIIKPNVYLNNPANIYDSFLFIFNTDIKSLESKEEKDNEDKISLEKFIDRCSNYTNEVNCKNIVYDENWYKHIYYIKGIDREWIIKWLRMLNSGVKSRDIFTFIHFRDLSIDIVDSISKSYEFNKSNLTCKPTKSVYGYENKFEELKKNVIDDIHNEALQMNKEETNE